MVDHTRSRYHRSAPGPHWSRPMPSRKRELELVLDLGSPDKFRLVSARMQKIDWSCSPQCTEPGEEAEATERKSPA